MAAQIHYDVHGLQKHVKQLINNIDSKTKKNQFVLASCMASEKSPDCENPKKNKVLTGPQISTLREMAFLGGRLQVKAQYWTQAHVVANPNDRLTRGRIVTFINLVAQYSGQLINRSDVLLKQLDQIEKDKSNGNQPSDFPLSVYLRDTELSDALNLYVWNRAAAPATTIDTFFHTFEALSAEETADRVRTAERVFDDLNWQRINEVFASGRGDMNLVLMKDEIGNWTLKTFDSDPADLLDAYTNIAKTALETIAAGGTGGVARLRKANKILQAAVSPGRGATGGETDEMIAGLRAHYTLELNELGKVTVDASDLEAKEARKNKVNEILTRYRSTLSDIQRLSDEGLLPVANADGDAKNH